MNHLLFFFALSLFSPSAFSKDRTELDATMQRLFHSLVNLQIMAATPERFATPENQEAVKRDLEVLAKAKHAFPTKPKSEEPGMTAVISAFSDYVKETRDSLSHGNTEFARHRVRTMGSFCLSCHSRTASPQDFEDVASRVSQLPLKDFEKAQLFAATRQFDKAIGTFRLYLQATPKSELDFLNYTRGLQDYVRLMVRVKQDPESTLKTLETLAKRKDLPEYDKRLIKTWAKDTAFWNNDKIKSADLTPEALLERAETLVKRAESLYAYPSDENGDISYLRASGYLHELLERDPKSKLRGEALYLLGITYGALQESFLWDLDKVFFEQCIRENPHSELSKKCYRRYMKAIYFNYSGTGGTYVPDEAMAKIKELRDLTASK